MLYSWQLIIFLLKTAKITKYIIFGSYIKIFFEIFNILMKDFFNTGHLIIPSHHSFNFMKVFKNEYKPECYLTMNLNNLQIPSKLCIIEKAQKNN